MQKIHQVISRFLGSKATAFLKRSFFFALLYSSMLYILVRIFFYEFPFTVREGFELHNKILLVVWIFIITCKVFITATIMVEDNLSKINTDRARYLPAFKKTILIRFTAALPYAGQANPADSNVIAGSGNNSGDELSIEPDMNFQ